MRGVALKTVTAVLLIGMLLLLAGTNPEPDEFREWLRLQVLSRAEVESPVITTFATVLGLDKVVVNALVSRSERKDFIFFSVYTLSISTSETWNIVGMFNRFIPLRDMSYVFHIDRL